MGRGVLFPNYGAERSACPHVEKTKDNRGADMPPKRTLRRRSEFRRDVTERIGAEHRVWKTSRAFAEPKSTPNKCHGSEWFTYTAPQETATRIFSSSVSSLLSELLPRVPLPLRTRYLQTSDLGPMMSRHKRVGTLSITITTYPNVWRAVNTEYPMWSRVSRTTYDMRQKTRHFPRGRDSPDKGGTNMRSILEAAHRPRQ